MGRRTAEALRHFFEMTVADQWAVRGLMLTKLKRSAEKERAESQTELEPEIRKNTLVDRTFVFDRRDPNRAERGLGRRAADRPIVIGG